MLGLFSLWVKDLLLSSQEAWDTLTLCDPKKKRKGKRKKIIYTDNGDRHIHTHSYKYTPCSGPNTCFINKYSFFNTYIFTDKLTHVCKYIPIDKQTYIYTFSERLSPKCHTYFFSLIFLYLPRQELLRKLPCR